MICPICGGKMIQDKRFSSDYDKIYNCTCGFKVSIEDGKYYPNQEKIKEEDRLSWEELEKYYE